MSQRPSHLIWILEDDPGAVFVYEECFRGLFNLELFSSLQNFQKAVSDPSRRRPDLLIADLTLTDGFFLDVAPVPFPMMIASSNDHLDILRRAYSFGASDYLIKPFRKSELLAKTEALLKKGPEHEFVSILSDLTRKEEQILSKLRLAGPTGLQRPELIRAIWSHIHVTPKTLDVHLVHLRRKLETTPYQIRSCPDGRLVLENRQENPRS